MKILVACEESQAVTIELRKLGHEAYSCDIIECSGGRPEWHIMQDVLPLLNGNCTFRTMDGAIHSIDGKWDMIIAFPPCTDLASSGAAWFKRKQEDGRQQKSIAFFMHFANADCEKIVIENPIGIMSSLYRKPDQIIQPWMFKDNVQKSTCLWEKGVSPLIPDVTEKPDIKYKEWICKKTGRNKRQSEWYYSTRCMSGRDRALMASKTFPGIARAMAEQWAGKREEE